MSEHHYNVKISWTGNRGTGTSAYKAYGRDFTATSQDKPVLQGSSDPAFLGDPAKWNPEDMLVASIAACHKLWYLHLCAVNNIIVTSYVDNAVGYMVDQHPTRKGHFTKVILHPEVEVMSGSDKKLAIKLHDEAHHECFLANSVNFEIQCEPTIK
ncbi:OsmC/Ohr family protein [Pseudomonas orientalis]|uniref:OsmC family protein n=1 Tax=Pseudomonas orientalis TaxID=76758 RepID=UPI000F56FA24|nr:OsmC family protein [Pseudomonas orientalis]AZE92915.1 OsmC/Ohr family protein [Pseudomonas orientalis]AZE98269.1 OsmC/Ohr family protein [Pseudomonas orientalis]